MGNVEGFITGYMNSLIESNSETINMHLSEIRKKSKELGVDCSKHNLYGINNKDDLGKFIAYGNYLITQITFDHVEKNDVSKELAFNYLKIAKIVGHSEVTGTAEGLAKIIIGSEEK